MKGRTTVERKKKAAAELSPGTFASLSEDFDSSGQSAPSTGGHDFRNVSMTRPQAKLTVSQPGDRYEREADQVADRIMRMEEPDGDNQSAIPLIARKEHSDMQLADDVTPIAQAGLQSSGEPLDSEARALMETRFDEDFSQVRVHTNDAASKSSDQMSARAYTVGSDIAFRSGEFSPDTAEGKHLLAHELAHVVQQSGNVQRDTKTTPTPAVAAPTNAAPPSGTPSGPVAKPARDFTLIVIDINNQYQTLFDKQLEAVKELETDFASVDEPSTTDMLMQVAIGFALGQAATALAGIIGTAAGKAADDFILKKALAIDAAGGIVDMEKLVLNSGAAREKATAVAGAGGKWISDKAKEQVPKSFQSVATSAKASQKFLESHRKSLIDMKAAAQSELLNDLAPGFATLPPNEKAVAAERFLAGVKKAQDSATQVQYLNSVAQWGQLISGGASADLTVARSGVLRMQYSAASPTSALTITKAELTDMDQQVLERVHDQPNLASMKLSDFPISKVFSSSGGLDDPPFIIAMPGQAPELRTFGSWAVKRSAMYGQPSQQELAGLMVSEMENITLGQLGVIKK